MRLLLLALLLLPTLTACETWHSLVGKPADAPQCLPVLAPDSLASIPSVTLALGPVTCTAAAAGGMQQTVALNLAATREDKTKNASLAAPFFAAVVDAKGAVVAKKLYRTTFDFGSGASATETVTIVFNLTAEQSRSANIYVGLSESVPSTL